MEDVFKFEMGAKLKDSVTGFTGIVTARYEFINGCVQYCLEAKAEKKSEKPQSQVYDEDRLEPVANSKRFTLPGAEVRERAAKSQRKPGGPHGAPTSAVR